MIGEKLGPYEILESIGSGGMGEVWKARDTRLGRIVAIKKVKEQHSERFKQEARSIAALNHPNICQIFDIGDDYLVLEYVEGKPLSSPLPEQEAIRLAIQIASALEAAHKKGIIHRDLKPSNIMVTDESSAKLLDFGLAKLYEQGASVSSLPTADFPATQAGAILGTVAYMSPEQAQGKPVDARSDIFSFGLVLYEILSGKKAFSGDSPSETIAALLRDVPLPLKTSPPLEKIVKRCLEKQPSARYQTMLAVRTELEKVLEGMQSKASVEPQPSIAVLPFINMSSDKEQEYFSDGLAEEIINALTKVPGLQVIARTSAFAFKGKDQDITKIAEALRVSNILEGSVRKSGSRIRVTAQLIEASTGIHLWSERYDREMTDVFEIQDEICQAIVNNLRVRLVKDRPRIKHHTENVEAYNLYLKGHYLLHKFTPADTAKSREYFEQAVAADPKYALAWFGLADFHYLRNTVGYVLPDLANAQGRPAAIKALDLGEMLPEAHSLMGMICAFEYNWQEAEREFRRTLELAPLSEDCTVRYCYCYLDPMRRLEESIDFLQKALDVNPISAQLYFQLGRHYYYMGQFEQAIRQSHNALELDPNYFFAYMYLALSYLERAENDEAVKAAETAVRIARIPIMLGYLGYVYAQSGRIPEAQKIHEELQELTRKIYVPAITFAAIHVGLGEINESFECLEKAIDEHNAMIFHFVLPPFVKHLRPYPLYKALLGKMNLEP